MAFEAKDLRVQLPCGNVTVLKAGGGCHLHFTCVGFTGHGCYHFTCGFTFDCGGPGSIVYCQPGTRPDPCGAASPVIELTPQVLCAGSDAIDVRTVLTVEELGVLRTELEKKLGQVADAQRAIEGHQGESAAE